MNSKDKARMVYYSGSAVVEKEKLPDVLKELENYNGIFYSDIEMNNLVLIEKASTSF